MAGCEDVRGDLNDLPLTSFSAFSDVKIKLLGQSAVQCGACGYSVNASHYSSTALEWQNVG